MNDRLKEIQHDVDEMNKSFSDGLAEEPIVTEEPTTDEPVIDDPKTDPPATEEPELESKEEEPKTSAPTTEQPDDRDQVITDLRARLEEKETPASKPPTTEAPFVFKDHDFLGDTDIEDITNDPDKFNKLMNKIYQQAVTDTRSEIKVSTPELVRSNMEVFTEIKEATDKFYEANEDLAQFRRVVSAVFDDLRIKTPNKQYSELLNDVATESRIRIGLQKPTENKSLDKGKPPKLPRKKGKSGKPQDKPNITPIESEIGEMNETLGR